ncbi:hypothetical protein GcM3_081009 [Golovinomyces cichoracearum]|uniref:2EXR domain-containing protein n=1 Tax=Golovinomyces cichoracearum TaxID=62708 RepID=A0A420INB5_9PEZI|nr:hypothetical protein GcM3_081009 [Golovinomyces cichoracearum]
MSEHNLNIPDGCPRFNNGLSCHIRNCPYTHCHAEREEALMARKRQVNNKQSQPTTPLNNNWNVSGPQNKNYVANKSPSTATNMRAMTTERSTSNLRETNSPKTTIPLSNATFDVKCNGLMQDSDRTLKTHYNSRSLTNSTSKSTINRNNIKSTENLKNRCRIDVTRIEHAPKQSEILTTPTKIEDKNGSSPRSRNRKDGLTSVDYSYMRRTLPGIFAMVAKNSVLKSQVSISAGDDSPVPESKIPSVPESKCVSIPDKSVSTQGKTDSSIQENSTPITVKKKKKAPMRGGTSNGEISKEPPSSKQISHEVIRVLSSESSKSCHAQEVPPDIWDNLRLQWVDNLSPKNKKAYLRDFTINQDGKLIRKVDYKAKSLRKSLTGSSSKRSFGLFTSLPAEIRNQIWKFAKQDCASTCYVHLHIKQEPGGRSVIINGKPELVPYPVSDAKFSYLYDVPGLYGACRESRSFVEDLYGKPKMTAVDVNTQKPYPSGKGSCILNYNQDRLFFISRGSTTQLPELVQFLRHEERKQIKHLAIPLRDYFHEEETVVMTLVHFPNLQTIDLVIGDGKDDLERLGNFDYSHYLRRSLRKQYIIDDRELHENYRNQWSVPKVKIDHVNEVQAHLWGIDGLKWGTTTRPIPRRIINA